MSIVKEFSLNNAGDLIPLIGYGTFNVQGEPIMLKVLDCALAAGYRLIDTAVSFGNEEDIGNALVTLLPKHKLKREDIFITSKLPPTLCGNLENILEVVQNSLSKLKTTYLDLYLIHWPGVQGCSPQVDNNAEIRDQTWQALIEAKNRGWLKNIGVSNYTVQHLTELLENHHGVLPAVNQVEWHPFCHQTELLQMCQEYNIFLQAYSSLGGTEESRLFLRDATVLAVAQKLKRPPAQVLLAWALQQGVGVIPKSLRKSHIVANFNYEIKIPDEEMNTLNNLRKRRISSSKRETVA